MTNRRHVALGTISFTVCFAAWGLIGAFAPRFREALPPDAIRDRAAGGVPVLLGSLARIPMGILTDRFGGRSIFSILMAAVAIPGLARAAAVHLFGPADRRFPARAGRLVVRDRRRLRLALDAAGAPGQRARRLRPGQHRAVGGRISGPGARRAGWHGRRCFTASPSCWWFGRSPSRCWRAMLPRPATAQRKGLGAMLEVLTREKLSWLLSAFYFLTFGGFVAFSIYLPTLAEGRVPSDARRRRLPHRRLRGAGDPAAPAGRLALRPHRRRARAVRRLPRRRSLRAAAGLAVDDSLHGRRARLRGAARAGQWRGLQAGAAVLPDADRHGDRTGRRDGRPRRLLPAAAAGVLPQPHRRHLAGLRAARRHRAGCCGGPTTASSSRGSRRSTSRCRPTCAAPPTACAPAPGPRSGPRCWSPPSWSARATCRTSTRRW